MKKLKQGRKFGRTMQQRNALLNSLARSLFIHEKMTTTEAKAKELSMFAEKCITVGKKGDLSARRTLAESFSKEVVKKLVEVIAPKYKERNGGYTRIIKKGPRKSDAAKIAIIELV
ncbi:50S ribosomal protein L17 [Patescibacteria group bacterium]|nr:50S ribosomal protein L17 [Patescibacteria group bacterium]